MLNMHWLMQSYVLVVLQQVEQAELITLDLYPSALPANLQKHYVLCTAKALGARKAKSKHCVLGNGKKHNVLWQRESMCLL